jgi:hypothetical protein
VEWKDHAPARRAREYLDRGDRAGHGAARRTARGGAGHSIANRRDRR